MKNNAICYIAGAGSWYGGPFAPNDGDCVIAADGGYRYLLEHNIRVDLVMGDFDSIERPDVENVRTYQREKDDTDLLIAVKEGYARGYRNFILYGGTGGDRFDHTVGNLQVLIWLAKRDARSCLIGKKTMITAVHNGTITLPPEFNGYISVFSMSEKAEGVTIAGLKYTMENGTLTNDYPLGVSNEFIGRTARISVQNGTLLVVAELADAKGLFL